MHIVEVNEHLDYNKFYTFPPEVTDITKAAGNRTWEAWEGLADHYPCPPCKPFAQALAHGGHDVVNILLGKPVHTPKHLLRLFETVEEARRRYDSKHVSCVTGRCPVAKHRVV